jgi:hypothetical protein
VYTTKASRLHLEKSFETCERMTWTEEGTAMAQFRPSRAFTALGEADKAKVHACKAKAIKDNFLEQHPQYISPNLQDEEVYNQMIPIGQGDSQEG